MSEGGRATLQAFILVAGIIEGDKKKSRTTRKGSERKAIERGPCWNSGGKWNKENRPVNRGAGVKTPVIDFWKISLRRRFRRALRDLLIAGALSKATAVNTLAGHFNGDLNIRRLLDQGARGVAIRAGVRGAGCPKLFGLFHWTANLKED